MPIDIKNVLAQIDTVLSRSNELIKKARGQLYYSDETHIEQNEIKTLLAATIDRLAPPGTRYRIEAHETLKSKYDISITVNQLIGILKALRADYEAGHLVAIHELIHADIFSDFLQMANYLIEGNYKDPAAVLAGGTLEEHLRKLCQKNNIEIMKDDSHYRTADSLNADLAGANVYSKLDQKSATAWLDLRNKAAHGKYDEYSKDQVALMVQGIRDFILRNPA